jgi:hypothetical protein
VIVGGVSLEAAPPARQDDAETASIIVNGRKGLNEYSHRGAPAAALSSAHPAIGRVACPLIGQPGGTSLWCLGFVLGGKISCQASAKHFQQRAEFVPLRNRGLGALAVPELPINRRLD